MYNYNYSYNMSNAAMNGLAAGLICLIIFLVIICIAIGVLKIIGTWKILTKANKPGWGALIPFYNSYLLCQITGVNPWWILIVFLGSFLSFIPIIGSLLSVAVSIYFVILLNVSLARSFGKEDGYAVGLILLSPIFYLILGCGKDEYIEPKPMNDIIFKDNNTNNTAEKTETKKTTTKKEAKYCSNCGKPVEKNTKFCANCGKEIK